ncbi:hypothetical protein LCGC14_0627880 [marine sediment metagenome]|uniref:Uncharacterized protein n=1 Tax=marine sediment metagenome TaxID=412755 RepID=A0A0F9UBD5_9ZZZZ
MKEHPLLKEQEKTKSPAPDANVPTTLQLSKEEAEIATNQDKKVEAEIRTKLRQQGYQSLEDGLKDMESKRQEATQRLESAQEIENSAIKLKGEFEEEKQKAIRALVILKQREEGTNARLERAIKIENALNSKDERYTIAIKELQALIKYHHTYITPCVKSLKLVSKSIYTWIDLLNDTEYDFSVLYNYIGRVTRKLDNYIADMPAYIPNDIIPKDEVDE